jgi:hypothetical protein
MDAFGHLSAVDANTTLNVIDEVLPMGIRLGQLITRRTADRKVVGAAQRIACHLNICLEMLIIVNEVTINRCVEPETVALTGSRVAMDTH